jgi:imidazolonepropionase
VSDVDLLVTGVDEVATPVGEPPFAGDEMRDLRVIEDGAVAFSDGEIARVGTADALADLEADRVVDHEGGLLVPGLVDAHTHLVFGGDRADELSLKLSGQSYEEIHEEGGGIHSTVQATREASREQLETQARERLDACLELGTTTLEAKSGYALTVDGELEMLEVARALDEEHAVDVVSTLLGAHAVPEGEDRAKFVRRVCDELTPRVAEEGLAEFCDVFVDEGAFTVDEGRSVLEAGRARGLDVRIHADELACTRATRLGVQLGATSIDHLNKLHPEDLAAMSGEAFEGVATLCPVTPFTSRIAYAPARKLVNEGVPVALGSDLNPNAWCEGMPFAIALAVHGMRMHPSEALTAATANAACSLNRLDRGRLEEGCVGDAVVLDVPSVEQLGYRMGGRPATTVVKDGIVAVCRDA